MKSICSMLKTALNYMLIVFLMSLLGTMLLCASYAIPSDVVEKNLTDSKSFYENWPTSELLFDGVSGSYLNNYSDAYMLNMAICEGDGTLLEKAMSNYSYSYGENTFVSFNNYINDLDGWSLEGYERYWNGYLIFLKVVLVFCNYGQIRCVNYVIQTIMLCIVLAILYKKAGKEATAAFGVSILLMIPASICMCIHFSTMYMVFLTSLLCYLMVYDRNLQVFGHRVDHKYLFLLTGILVTFFELSTFPLISLTYLMILEEILDRNTISIKRRLYREIKNAIAWVTGYIGIWGIKWILASIVTHKNVIGNAIGQVLFRTSSNKLDGERIYAGQAILINMKDFVNPISLTIIVISLGLAIVITVNCRKRIKINKSLSVMLLLIALAPFAWLEVKANHSYIHHWMVYRELTASFCALLMIPLAAIHK